MRENGLREPKQIIYETIKEQIPDNVEEFKVLEIGCLYWRPVKQITYTNAKLQELSHHHWFVNMQQFGLDIIMRHSIIVFTLALQSKLVTNLI